MKNIKNLLTFDLEEYFQVENFKKVIRFTDWEARESRVDESTRRILCILEQYDVRATFFVLGWIAERLPGLVEKIHDAGHEIASHGYAHELITGQTPEIFRDDIKKSKKILEEIIGEPVNGYRAPSFSLTNKTVWALGILREEGFLYDSSVFPAIRDRGGMADAEPFPHRIGTSEFREVPVSVIRVPGQNLPFAGGGYFRLLPYGVVKWGIRRVNKSGSPAVLYLHPWELDPEQPRIHARFTNSFRHYVNLDKTENKLRQLLADFQFGTIGEFLKLPVSAPMQR